MNSNLFSALESAGVDTDSAVARFAGNAELYIKFMRRFPADDTFPKIGQALAKEDWLEMQNAAHTLKGVSANLGMGRLFLACSDAVRLLREGDFPAAAASYEQLTAAYNEVCTVLRQFEEESL